MYGIKPGDAWLTELKKGEKKMKDRVVETQYGAVSGVASDTEGVVLFKGIPIGADTAGQNRFREPQPAAPWEGIRVCDTWPDRFLQELSGREPGSFWGDEFYYDPNYNPGNSENGLAVNVFAPEKGCGEEQTEPLPVFVYIHGGGFSAGYASEIEFNASHLAAQGVVVVLLQYRLSALGWLALPELSAEGEHGVSGNYAVLDLVHGLKWVRDNIAGFGGDASKVTIAGQSAGAMAVTCLLRTPLAKGLFRAAIVQSGFNGFLNVGTMKTDVLTLKEAEEKNAAALKEIFGHEVTVEELRRLSSADFLKPGPNAKSGMGGQPMTLLQEISQAVGHMVIDGYVFTEESVHLLKPGQLDGIQIMMGGTSDEATSLFGDFISHMGITPENAGERLDGEYGVGCSAHYPIATKEEAEASLMRAQSDQCLQKYLLTAALTEDNQAHETYVYYFRQVPPGRNSAFKGAYHSSELWYMFDSIREGVAHREWRQEDYKTAELMSTYWMNFVKYGNPNGERREIAGHTASGKEMAIWEPCRKANDLPFLELVAGTSKMVKETAYPERDRYHRNWLEEQLS